MFAIPPIKMSLTMHTQMRALAGDILAISGLDYAYFIHSWRMRAPYKDLLTEWNRKHRALFVHVPKNAGTSIAAMLQMQRCADFHAPAVAYKAADPEFYASAFKFAVVRNPWDRFVSAFHYIKYSKLERDVNWRRRYLDEKSSFEDFIELIERRGLWNRIFSNPVFRPQHHFLCDRHTQLMVDWLVRYESLEDELSAIAQHIGVAVFPAHDNASSHENYISYFDQHSRDVIARLYADDIELFGYSFSPPARPAAAHAVSPKLLDSGTLERRLLSHDTRA
jgi:chondroitin 4-sulfotransferase 11